VWRSSPPQADLKDRYASGLRIARHDVGAVRWTSRIALLKAK